MASCVTTAENKIIGETPAVKLYRAHINCKHKTMGKRWSTHKTGQLEGEDNEKEEKKGPKR